MDQGDNSMNFLFIDFIFFGKERILNGRGEKEDDFFVRLKYPCVEYLSAIYSNLHLVCQMDHMLEEWTNGTLI